MRKIILAALAIAAISATTAMAAVDAGYSEENQVVYVEGSVPNNTDVATILLTNKETGDIEYVCECKPDVNNRYYAKFNFDGDIDDCVLTVREGSRNTTSGVTVAKATSEAVLYAKTITDEGKSTKITAGEVVKLIINATNKYKEGDTFKVLIAYYDDENRLISCDDKIATEEIGYEPSKTIEIDAIKAVPENAVMVKAFIWQNIETAIPLSNSDEKEVLVSEELPEIAETDLASTITMISQSVGTSHLQGIAIDRENGYIYASISNALVKSDMNGNIVGSIYNLPGHIGDTAFNPQDGKLYSAHYVYSGNGYVSIIDGDDLTEVGMEYEDHKDILKSVHTTYGMDGAAFAPDFGKTDSDKLYLYVTTGGTTHKEVWKYDVSDWAQYETVWDGKHTNGPDAPEQKYYVYMGTTTYGIQNLDYDPYTESMFACIYGVTGTEYPKYCTYAIDMTAIPEEGYINNTDIKGAIVKFAPYGAHHEATGIWGSSFNKGSHGFAAVGNGYYYVIESQVNSETEDRKDVYGLYKWTGGEKFFERVAD